MPKQILVLKPKNFLTFICLPASLIEFYYVGYNKSFEGIAGIEKASKLYNEGNENNICFGIDKTVGEKSQENVNS